MTKILPPGLTFEQCVIFGHAGRIESEPYLAWLRTLPCHTCGKPAPSEASHLNSVKGGGTKAPDWFSIPECSGCNRNYDLQPPMVEQRMRAAIFYLLQAIYEGRLRWVAHDDLAAALRTEFHRCWTKHVHAEYDKQAFEALGQKVDRVVAVLQVDRA